MTFIRAEIAKRRKEHRKTIYRVVLVQQTGFWIWKAEVRCELNWPFDSYEQAYKWTRRNYPDIDAIVPETQK